MRFAISTEEKFRYYILRKSKEKNYFINIKNLYKIIKNLNHKQKYLEIIDIKRYFKFLKKINKVIKEFENYDLANYFGTILSISNLNQFYFILEFKLLSNNLNSNIVSYNLLQNLILHPKISMQYLLKFFSKLQNTDFENILLIVILDKKIDYDEKMNAIINQNCILESLNRILTNDLIPKMLKSKFFILKSKIMLYKKKKKESLNCLIEGYIFKDDKKSEFRILEHSMLLENKKIISEINLKKYSFLVSNYDFLISKFISYFMKCNNLSILKLFTRINLKSKKPKSVFFLKKIILRPFIENFLKLFKNFIRISLNELCILSILNFDFLLKMISIIIFKSSSRIIIDLRSHYIIKLNLNFSFYHKEILNYSSSLFSLMHIL